MDIKNESTHEITVFWELFNEILSNIKSRNYKLNPRAVMVNGMVPTIVLYERFLSLICHIKGGGSLMHYKNDVNRVSFRIGPSYRDFFKTICHEMCSVVTVAE